MILPYLQNFSLQGKIALITGAARDIGFEIATAMAGSGAHVILNGRDQAALSKAAEQLQQQGYKAATLAFDICDGPALKNAFREVAEQYGRLDILVSNAGLRERKLLQDFSDEDIQRMLDTNLIAPYRLAREAAKLMLPKSTGRLIFITSIAGQIARSGDAVYTGAKQGVAGMMRALAAEYGPKGITSNAIAPGGVATESNATMLADPKAQAHFKDRTPLGRWAEPKEIAGAAVFLASPAASYINGHVLTVDGGMSITM